MSANCNTRFIKISTAIIIILFAKCLFAFHPLITDDAPTIGKGVIQFEASGDYGRDRVDSRVEQSCRLAAVPAYGLLANLDFFLGIDYTFLWQGHEETGRGISDIFFESKWNFFNWGPLHFTLKPGITFPTGDYTKGFGAGECGYYILLLTTISMERVHFHMNFGYTRNENKIDEFEDIWHVSAAVEIHVAREFRFVADTGAERNPDPSDDTVPCFLLVGFLWSPSNDIDFDIAYKYGITDPETDHTVIIGVTARF